jgi:protein-disulfide isomerase
MKAALVFLAAGAAAVALTVGLPGQSTDVQALKKEIEALKARQTTLERELADLRARVTGQPRPEASISLSGAKIRGNADAKVMLLEFSDYQCPFCGRHFRETMPQLEKAYIETGKIRYAFRDFPIQSLHQQSPKAHEAANCVGDQGKFWPMHTRLFMNPNPLGPEELKGHATSVGADLSAFQQCLDSGKHAPTVQQGVDDAAAIGVTGTPAFFIGTVDADGKNLKAVRFISGAHPFGRFKQELDAVLDKASSPEF